MPQQNDGTTPEWGGSPGSGPGRTGRGGAGAGRGLSRAGFLRAAAGAVVGGGALLAGAGAVQAVTGSDGGGGAGAPRPSAGEAHPRALNVTMVRDLTGPHATAEFGMAATDLGVPARTPDGRLLFVFGDTWEDRPFGADWRSPVALWSETTDLAQGVQWSGAVGGARARQLWDYEHGNPEFDTVLPGDVITIGDTMYLHVAVQQPYPTVVWTEIWRSTDSGATWQHTGCRWGKPGDPYLHPLFQMVTWGLGDNGYVYVYSDKFDRTGSLLMHRVLAERITEPTAYEPWCWTPDRGWFWGVWGDQASPILEGRFGELCLRPIDGKWLLTCLNLDTYSIEGRILDTPESNLVTAPVHTLIKGVEWADNQPEVGRVAQPYGGYVIPGSTLGDLHLAVSQWENPDHQHPEPDPQGWHYHVMQHRVTGLV